MTTRPQTNRLVTFFFVKPAQTKIDTINVDCTLEENPSYTATVTSEPVEDGAFVSDNITLDPFTVRLKGIISDTPYDQPLNLVKGLVGEQVTSRAKEAFEQLYDLYAKKQVFDVVTGDRLYQNVAFTSFDPKRDVTTGKALRFNATFQQIIKVSPARVKIPREKVSANPPEAKDQAQSQSDKGTQQPVNKDDLHQRSVLAGLFDVFKGRLKWSELPQVAT